MHSKRFFFSTQNCNKTHLSFIHSSFRFGAGLNTKRSNLNVRNSLAEWVNRLVLISLHYRIHFQHQNEDNEEKKIRVNFQLSVIAVCQFESINYNYSNQWTTKWFSIRISWLLNDVECCYRFIAKLPRMKIEIVSFPFSISLSDKILYLFFFFFFFWYQRTVFQLFIDLNLFFKCWELVQCFGFNLLWFLNFVHLFGMLFSLFRTWVNGKEQSIQSKNWTTITKKNTSRRIEFEYTYIFNNICLVCLVGWLQRVKRVPQRLQISMKITSKTVVLKFQKRLFESIDATEWNEYNEFIEPKTQNPQWKNVIIWKIRQIARHFGTTVSLLFLSLRSFDAGSVYVENV